MSSAQNLPPLAQATAGAVGAVLSNVLIYPLDTVTTRVQTASSKSPGSKASLLSVVRSILREGGIGALYRGLPSDSISTGLSNFIYFFVYSFLYEAVSKRKASRAGKNVTGGAKASPTAALSALEGIVVGCLAGIVAKSCTSPLSNITVRQQTAATSSKTADKSAKGADDGSESDDSEDGTYTVTPSMIEVANDIVDENGWTGLWAGMKASVLLSVTPGITYYAFDVLRRAIIPKRHQEHPTALQTFIAGSLAASSASIITYPLILCKTKQQFKSPSGRRLYKSLSDVFRKTIRKRGVAGMYQGLESQVAKNFLSEGVKLTLKDRLEVIIVLMHRIVTRQKALA